MPDTTRGLLHYHEDPAGTPILVSVFPEGHLTKRPSKASQHRDRIWGVSSCVNMSIQNSQHWGESYQGTPLEEAGSCRLKVGEAGWWSEGGQSREWARVDS